MCIRDSPTRVIREILSLLHQVSEKIYLMKNKSIFFIIAGNRENDLMNGNLPIPVLKLQQEEKVYES